MGRLRKKGKWGEFGMKGRIWMVVRFYSLLLKILDSNVIGSYERVLKGRVS